MKSSSPNQRSQRQRSSTASASAIQSLVSAAGMRRRSNDSSNMNDSSPHATSSNSAASSPSTPMRMGMNQDFMASIMSMTPSSQQRTPSELRPNLLSSAASRTPENRRAALISVIDDVLDLIKDDHALFSDCGSGSSSSSGHRNPENDDATYSRGSHPRQ